jgi:hypothetical protein
MDRTHIPSSARQGVALVATLVLGIAFAACASSGSEGAPTLAAVIGSPPASIAVRPSAFAPPSITPLPTPEPTVQPDATGQPSPPIERCESGWAVTIVDTLRVRSQPNVSDESIKYEPLLGSGSELQFVGGPAAGSGYWWYEVSLPPSVLRGGVTRGWIAAGDRDGTPWIQCMGID